MNVFKKVLTRLRRTTVKQAVVATVFTMAVAGVAVLGHQLKQTSYASDCSPNAVLHCGTSDPNNFINRVSANEQNTQHAYAEFGLPANDYARFRNEARPGVAYKDGTIVVDGRVVATDAWSIGRSQKSYSQQWHEFWASRAQDVFKSNSINVMVLFNDNGEMQFAVMYDCGNPTTGKIVRNSFECHALTKTAVAGQTDTYDFTVTAPHSDGVGIASIVYNYGDGTSDTVTNLNPVRHHFSKPGDYTVTVQVKFSLPGNKSQTIGGVNCQTPVTVVAPFYTCDYLQYALVDQGKFQYKFSVKGNAGNGATFTSVDFDFGDGNKQSSVKPDGTSVAVANHTYAKAGTYNIVPTLHFNTPSGEKTVVGTGNCAKQLKLEAPFVACTYLQVATVDKDKFQYKFTVKASVANNANFMSVDFDFGDNSASKNVKPGTGDQALIASTDYQYAKAGTYNVTPTLHFTTPEGDKTIVGTADMHCVGQVKPTLPPQPCTPGGTPSPDSQECNPKPCTEGGTPAPGTPQCTPAAPVMPNTGAGNVIGLFTGASVLGTAAHFLLQKRRLARDTIGL